MDYSRLKLSITLLMLNVSFGTIGYYLFEDMGLFDALYMTIITVSTVGFSEIKPLSQGGRIITMIIIIFGISVGTYTLGQVFRIFIEGELRTFLGRRKLEKTISNLKNHWIVCGYGRIGKIISRELAADKMKFIVIEQNPAKIEELEQHQYLYLNMDATTEEALLKAGIQDARGIVTAVRSDANNVFITLTAKGLRPDIFVLSRSSDIKNEGKLLKAGASRVVSPYLIGGKRMAQVLKRPTVVDFIDTAMMNGQLGLSMEEALIGDTSHLLGKTLLESNIRQDYGIIIVAIKKPTGDMVFNPAPDEKLAAGDVVVILGKKKEDLDRLTKALQ